MPMIVLPLLFLGTGLLSVWYYRFVPPGKDLRQRLPNKVSFAAIILTVAISIGLWYVFRKLGGRFDRVSGITTLVFFLLTFETFLLIFFRWFRSNALAVVLGLSAAAVPFGLQLTYPSYWFINTIIIFATLGATTLIVRATNLRTGIIIAMSVLLGINDVIVVSNLTPNLPLTPIADTPLRLLIFPTLVAGGRVVGSGDVMFLALTTIVILRDLGRTPAMAHVVFQSIALAITLAATQDSNGFVPFLTVMVPIFLLTYLISRRIQNQSSQVNAS